MNPERARRLVVRWVRLYTNGLPAPVARRRIEEVQADLHDHIAHERSRGTTDGRIALAVASRMLRGVAADVAWREHESRTASLRTSKEERMETGSTIGRSVLRVSIGVAAVLAIPLIGMALSDEVAWGVFDFVLAGVLLGVVGASFELAARRSGNGAIAAGLVALGVIAGLVGEADDAPGMVLLGGLMIAGGAAIAFRRLRSAT